MHLDAGIPDFSCSELSFFIKRQQYGGRSAPVPASQECKDPEFP